MIWKTIWNLFHATRRNVCHFIAICEFKFELPPGNTQIRDKSSVLHPVCPWKWRITLKTIGHLFYATSRFAHHFIAISECKLGLQSGNAQFDSKLAFFVPYDLEMWQMPLKNNRAPLLCYFKFCASFQNHRWIQTGVTISKPWLRRQAITWINDDPVHRHIRASRKPRDHPGEGLIQWETMLHYDIVYYWQSSYAKWSLSPQNRWVPMRW